MRAFLPSWIQIRIQEGKNDTQKIEQEILCFEVLDVIFLGKASRAVWASLWSKDKP
jgi:hypothetical protein